MFKIAVLSSGKSRGSNLRALAHYFQSNSLPVSIAFAVNTRSDAPAVNVCADLGIQCYIIPYSNQFESRIIDLCCSCGICLIALSGFLKKLSAVFLLKTHVPVLNIHPALLPLHGGDGLYGMNVHKEVYQSGDKISGATVHLVNKDYDKGSIIAQEIIDISGCQTPEDIARAVLKKEHELYGKAIWDFLTQSRHE